MIATCRRSSVVLKPIADSSQDRSWTESVNSIILKAGLGAPVVAAYTKLKMADWNEYSGQLTDWERRTTLDC